MPLEAAEMALLRVIHASELPDPGALIEKLASGEAVAAPGCRRSAAEGDAGRDARARRPASPALVELLAANGKPHLAQQLHDYAGLVRYAPPELVVRRRSRSPAISSATSAPRSRASTGADLEGRGDRRRGRRPTLLEQEKSEAERLRQAVLDSPLVKAAFDAFPDAELAGYTTRRTTECMNAQSR